jgi:energy-coupling factor transporter ATP-binding protein EcfA2
MDSQGVASSSMHEAESVARERHDSNDNGVTSEVADGGEGPAGSGDDTIVMTAPGHRSATEHAQPDVDESDVNTSSMDQPEDPDATQVFDAIRDDEETDTPEPEPESQPEPELESQPEPELESQPEPESEPEPEPESELGEPEIPLEEQHPQPHVRVDARLLEAALLNLRKRIAAIPLVFEIEGSARIKDERAKLLSQIDDYLLPRVRRSAAPVLVALVGSTGAGKSTLVNSIVGAKVSATGVRRPTTNSPVLACHPDDIEWFAENNFLPTLPRVRQEGLARPGRDGLLVLAASEGMPSGIALLDTPDIDSVVKAHHEFAYQFLDASDLWLFMTSSSRYADGPVWEILQHARDRRAALGVVLSRVPQSYRTELVDHFEAMLDANGITAKQRFVIPEIPLLDGMLPPDAYQEIRGWLADTAATADRRVAVLTQTMSGVLDTFKSRVPKVAAHVEAQVVLRARLRREAADSYSEALAHAREGLRNGTLLQGEVLARWQDCIASGDLRLAQAARPGKPGRQSRKGRRARRGPHRIASLDAALRAALESFVVSLGDRAAEQVQARWRATPAGALLLADAAAERARNEQINQVFESAFGERSEAAVTGPFSRSSPDLPLRAARAIAAWQDDLTRLTADRNAEAFSLVLATAVLADGSPDPIAGQARDLLPRTPPPDPRIDQARANLLDRIQLMFDEELLVFSAVIDSAGPCDDVAAIRLYQAEYSLEAVR